MNGITFYAYDGFGKEKQETLRYSQSARIGDRIEVSGQGGWDPKTSDIPKDLNEEMDQAFANVELALKDAGGKGWSQVYKIVSYHRDFNDEAIEATVRNLKKYTPDHRPLLTAVGVARLAFDDMRVEIEVVAYDPK